MSLPGIEEIVLRRQGEFTVGRYLTVVPWPMIIYDWLICLDEEVTYVWGARWTLGRVVYHYNRLWPLILTVSSGSLMFLPPLNSIEVCRRLKYLFGLGLEALWAGVSIVFVTRCWAVYDSRRVLYCLVSGWILTSALSMFFMKRVLDEVVHIANPAPGVITGCINLTPSFVWTIYFVPGVFDSIIFGMTVWKIWQSTREFGSTRLMKELSAQGAVYCGVLVVSLVAGFVRDTQLKYRISDNAPAVLGSLYSILCCRINLSLHVQGKAGTTRATGDPDTMGETRFAVPMQDVTRGTNTASRSVPV